MTTLHTPWPPTSVLLRRSKKKRDGITKDHHCTKMTRIASALCSEKKKRVLDRCATENGFGSDTCEGRETNRNRNRISSTPQLVLVPRVDPRRKKVRAIRERTIIGYNLPEPWLWQIQRSSDADIQRSEREKSVSVPSHLPVAGRGETACAGTFDGMVMGNATSVFYVVFHRSPLCVHLSPNSLQPSFLTHTPSGACQRYTIQRSV